MTTGRRRATGTEEFTQHQLTTYPGTTAAVPTARHEWSFSMVPATRKKHTARDSLLACPRPHERRPSECVRTRGPARACPLRGVHRHARDHHIFIYMHVYRHCQRYTAPRVHLTNSIGEWRGRRRPVRGSVSLLEGGAQAEVGMQGCVRACDSDPATNGSRRDENDSTAAAGAKGRGGRAAGPTTPQQRRGPVQLAAWCSNQGPDPPPPPYTPTTPPSRPKPTNMGAPRAAA
jgi:hypothetical protein